MAYAPLPDRDSGRAQRGGLARKARVVSRQPVQGCTPPLCSGQRPAVREPQCGQLVAPVGDERGVVTAAHHAVAQGVGPQQRSVAVSRCQRRNRDPHARHRPAPQGGTGGVEQLLHGLVWCFTLSGT